MNEENKKTNYNLAGVTFKRCNHKFQGIDYKSSKDKSSLIVGISKILYEEPPHVFSQQLESALRKLGCWVSESGVDQDLNLSSLKQPRPE